jgi:hypothetical protein
MNESIQEENVSLRPWHTENASHLDLQPSVMWFGPSGDQIEDLP